MAIFPYLFINLKGIPTIESTGVTVGTDAVDFNFRADASFGNPFRGLLIVNLKDAIPTTATSTFPIRFTSSVGTQNVTTYGNVNWTVDDFNGIGVYLFYYDRRNNTLQKIG